MIVYGFVGIPFSEQLSATGGVPPYHFSVAPPTSLPSGLTLNPTSGLISGTPTMSPGSLVVFHVTDSATPGPGFSGSPPQTMVVNQPHLVITTGLLPVAQTGHPYAQTLSEDMGAPPLHWSISAGALPSGLSLNAGSGAITGTPSQAGTSTFTVKVTDSATPTAQTATSSFTLTVAPTVLPEVFVTNGGNSVVNAFALAANGNASPLTVLGGTMTALSAPSAVTIDPTGRVYLANSANNTVTEYANGITGNAPPSSIISGTATGLATPTALALDANGLLYVANGPANTITVFARGASGNAAPVATIAGGATQLTYPSALAVDHAGDLWVANLQSSTLTEYRPGANGNVGPAAVISGTLTGLNGPQGMTIDPAGNLLVANTYGNSITEYKTTDNGSPLPQRLLFGSSTGLGFPRGIDVDTGGNIYVANDLTNTVAVYAPSANNNTGPMQVITGASTGLRGPVGLAVAPPLALLTTKLPPARAGHRYRARLRAVLGTTPYRFTVIRGHLPHGIRLTRSGRLTGRPRRRGTYRFTVRVTDSTHSQMTSTRRFVLLVGPR
jgi:large repetitive protein